MSNFALNLDLSLYFEDQRRYSCVFVDSTKCKDVGDVEKHIKSVFTLEESICLNNKKFLIPSCEDIRILQQYETVIVKKHEFQTQPNKSTETACQHLALNLVQEEKTIDLSCRPKQRLKINICRSLNSEAKTPTLIKKCELYVPRLKVASIHSNVIQMQQEEKQKKRNGKRNEGRSCDNETNDDILDMSIQPVIQGVGNRRTENEESENDMALSPEHLISINKIHVDELYPNESSNKSKKRKNPSELVENLSTTTTCDDMVTGHIIAVNDLRKHKKRSKKSRVMEDFSITDSDVSMQRNGIEEPSCSTNYEDDSIVHKTKKSKKSGKWEDFEQNVDYCVSKSQCTVDNDDLSTLNVSENEHSRKGNSLLKNLDKIEKTTDQTTRICFRELTPKNKFRNGDIENSNDTQKLNTGESESTETCNRSSNSIGESKSATPYIEDGTVCEESGKKKKRIRKHNKKKKRENRQFMFAVGSVLNRLNVQPQVHQPLASTPKHVFFTEDDAPESDISQASLNGTSTQEDSDVSMQRNGIEEPSCSTNYEDDSIVHKPKKSKKSDSDVSMQRNGIEEPSCSTNYEDDSIVHKPKKSKKSDKAPDVVNKQINSEESTQEISPQSPTTWQEGLLRLARSSSKPIIFHRSSTLTSNKIEAVQFRDSSKELPESDLSSVVNEEAKQFKGADNTVNSANSCHVDMMGEFGGTSDKESIKKCNGEILSDAPFMVCFSAAIERKQLEECNEPKINVQNIILDNYPIISKINRQDLILFKVLKINENKEPGISKTILAKVINCSSFPEMISLEIFDGSSECGDVGTENAEGLVEISWADMIEPRLFYP